MTERLQHDRDRISGGLAASRDMAARLAVSARKLRFSTSSRSALYKAVGLRPRLIERVFAFLVALATILVLVVPNAAALAYFGFLASDQYQSEARFTVRSSTPAIGKDQMAKVTGIPQAKIVQDTQMVTSFIESRDMLERLESTVGLRALYSSPDIDFHARLPEDASTEDRLKYWEEMVDTAISPSSGIVTVKVRAFSPEAALTILNDVIAASEAMVNGANDRMWADITATTRTNLDAATTQLRKTREELQAARNESGVLTVEGSSQIVSTLIGTIEAERLKLQQRYDAQLAFVSKDAPQMRVLMRDIEGKTKQVADLRQQLAGQTKTSRTLADVSLDMSQLQLAQTLAEQQFASSVNALEQVQFTSSQQLIYLDAFLQPRLPEEPQYPHRLFWILVTAFASLAVWGSTLGLLHVVRNQIAH